MYGAAVLSVVDAAREVLQRVPRVGVETIALDLARGRILAVDVVAEQALPGFDNSAMDGYAIHAEDTAGA